MTARSVEARKLETTRYQAGMPRVNDGALLFLQTMLAKMISPADASGKAGPPSEALAKEGSRIAIIFNGSPLSNGDCGSGESEIRRWVLENDWLDAIVMLPDQLFYNTGIFTYIWLLRNEKPASHRGRVMLIDARQQFEKEPKSFGNKRNRITAAHRAWIEQRYRDGWAKGYADENVKIFRREDFAYHKVSVVFWQTDENDQPAIIAERYEKVFTAANLKKEQEFFCREPLDEAGDSFGLRRQVKRDAALAETPADGKAPSPLRSAGALHKLLVHECVTGQRRIAEADSTGSPQADVRGLGNDVVKKIRIDMGGNSHHSMDMKTLTLEHHKQMSGITVLKHYDVAADAKKRISLRGAKTKYFHVKALSNGCYVLEPRVLIPPEAIPARTLQMLERSVTQLKKRKASAPVALPKLPPGESFYDKAFPILKKAWARRGRGLPDLATHPKYMEGFGE